MAQTQIRASTQIKAGSIVNDNIANSTIAHSKLDAANSPSTDDILSFNGTKFNWVNRFTIQSGLDFKESVRAATVGNITLSGTQTIDGVALVVGNRVLVKNQTTGSANGIYVVASGAWTRAADAVQGSLTANAFCFVEEGTTQGDTGWVLTTNDPITVGTTSLTFSQFSGAGAVTGSAPIVVTGNNISLNISGTTGLEVNSSALRVMTDGNTIERHSSGIRVVAGGISAKELGTNAVVTDKILDANVTFAKIENGAALSVLGRSANSSGVMGNIAAGTDGHVLRRSGTTLGFGTLAAGAFGSNTIPLTAIQDQAARTVLVNATNASGAITALASATDGHVLRHDGITLSWGQVKKAGIENAAVDYDKIDKNAEAGAFTFIAANPSVDMKFLNAFWNFGTVPTGTINGSNVTFSLASTPVAGTEIVYLNGLRLKRGAGDDYQISGATITMNDAPLTGDVLLVDFINAL